MSICPAASNFGSFVDHRLKRMPLSTQPRNTVPMRLLWIWFMSAVRSGVVDMVYSPCAFYAAVVPECDAVSASSIDGPAARKNGGTELLDPVSYTHLTL